MKSVRLPIFLVLATAAIIGTTLSSCNQQAIGISPHPEKLHYPLGIAVHPSGKFLYVANTNFDLAFTGGSIMVFDTEEKESDTFDIRGVKTELKTLKALPKATVEIGSFAGQIVIDAEGKNLYVAVRQEREQGKEIPRSAVVILKIDPKKRDSGHLQCSQYQVKKEEIGGVGEAGKFDTSPPPRCGNSSKIFLPKGSYPFGLALLQRCKPKRTCKTDDDCKCTKKDRDEGLCSGDQKCDFGRCIPGCKEGSCPNGQTCSLGRCRIKVDSGKKCSKDSQCPRGKRCDLGFCVPGCRDDTDCPSKYRCRYGRCLLPTPKSPALCTKNNHCSTWEMCNPEKLFISFLGTESLGYIDLTEKEKKYISLKLKEAPIAVSAVTLTPPGSKLPLTAFFTSKQENKIFYLPLPFNMKFPLSIPIINTEITRTTDYDLRGIAIGTSKGKSITRLFVAVRSPYPSIAVYRLKYKLNEDTGKNEISAVFEKSIPTGYGVSYLLYRNRPSPLSDLLYAIATRDRRLYIIDAETLQNIGKIYSGESPYFMAIFESNKNLKLSPRGYITNFLESTISIIDLNRHQMIGRIKGFDTRQPIR